MGHEFNDTLDFFSVTNFMRSSQVRPPLPVGTFLNLVY